MSNAFRRVGFWCSGTGVGPGEGRFDSSCFDLRIIHDMAIPSIADSQPVYAIMAV